MIHLTLKKLYYKLYCYYKRKCRQLDNKNVNVMAMAKIYFFNEIDVAITENSSIGVPLHNEVLYFHGHLICVV